MSQLRDDLREKCLPYAGLETPDQILKLRDEHEKAERVLLRIVGLFEEERKHETTPS